MSNKNYYKGIQFRFKDKEEYFDLMDKLKRDEKSFQEFVEEKIEKYLINQS